MGDTLFGGEKSGTPIETRGATKKYGRELASGGNPFGDIGVDLISKLFGFDPSQIGLGEAATGALADPRDTTKGLFSAMQPFEAEETERQTAGLRNIFGTMGGRFSRNVAEGESDLRGRLAAEFGRNREQALLQANAQRIQALAALLGNIGQVGTAGGANVANFLNPGAPNWREGIAGDVIGAAGTAAGGFFGGG